MQLTRLGEGIGGVKKTVTGEVVEWEEIILSNPDLIKEKIVYNTGNVPLYRMAFLIDNGVGAVLMEEGGKNYHPLILVSDAEVPAIVGIGRVDLHGKIVTVESAGGVIYEGKSEPKEEKEEGKIEIPDIQTKVYVNVGYPAALESASKSGADGIGLLRTEYTAVRTLSRILDKEVSKNVTIREAIDEYNEADVIYELSKNKDLNEYLKNDFKSTIKNAMKYFGEKEIIVRTLDLARGANDPMGNRGIRRCVGEGGNTIKILAEAIRESLEEGSGDYNIGVILPLVSHYSQVKTALDILLNAGLCLKRSNRRNAAGILFGWEIEQPAAAQNNKIWLEAFRAEYGYPPDIIGIGTNDLTQFTIALGRDVYTNEKEVKVKDYLQYLYDESDLSVVKQIYETKKVHGDETRLFLLGQAAAVRDYAELMLSFGIIPSVGIDSVKKVKLMAAEFEGTENKREEVIRRYVDRICDREYPSVKGTARKEILSIFDLQ